MFYIQSSIAKKTQMIIEREHGAYTQALTIGSKSCQHQKYNNNCKKQRIGTKEVRQKGYLQYGPSNKCRKDS